MSEVAFSISLNGSVNRLPTGHRRVTKKIKASNPKMPSIEIEASGSGGGKIKSVQYNNCVVKFNAKGRRDSIGPFQDRVNYSGNGVQTGRLNVTFGGKISGGICTFSYRAKWRAPNGREGWTNWNSYTITITGENARKSVVRSRSGDLMTSVIFYKWADRNERFLQFDRNGHPAMQLNKYGVSKISVPNKTDLHYLWNWKSNVDRGKKLIKNKKDAVIAHPGSLKKRFPKLYKNIPSFNSFQWRQEVFQQHAGHMTGKSFPVYHMLVLTDPENLRFEWRTDNADSFTKNSEKIYQDVKKKKYPQGWLD
ncbi:MAG: hypothetical protein GY751_21355 [Bacteroidetes bacterium]|nr:hypothetical protein [Bacteroidota bacterium]